MYMKTCAFITLGCKVNQYETQAIRESLAAKGFIEASPEQAADLYVINTCTVTSASDEKSRQYIKRVKRKNPGATVVVTGCYAEADTETIKNMEGVDYVVTKAEEARLAEIVSQAVPQHFPRETAVPLKDSGDDRDPPLSFEDGDSIFNMKISRFAGHTRGFLKIEDGCDMYCSYCIIPYVRGGIKSRKPQDIYEEAKRLVYNGYKEIILTGIHLGAYGRDTQENYRLLDVIYELSNISGLERVRFSSLEINEITEDFINLAARTKKICPHFHIPLQSGDDFILKKMNRKYTSLQYLETLDSIRSAIDLPSFTTDVMVGFPGEKDTHFENTIDVCKKAGFSRMHVFPFSARKGTPAAGMSGHCNPQIIRERKAVLESLASTLAFDYKKHFFKRSVEVLVETERESRTNTLCGYSERYIKALFEGPDALKNKVVSVRVEKVTPSFVFGTLS